MRRTYFAVPRFFATVAATCLLFVAMQAEAAVAWLAFLPKGERARAEALVATTDASLAALARDHSRAVTAERSYADAARVLAAILDEYAEAPDALSFALGRAGLGGASAGNAAGVLADKRRLRWEVSRDISNLGYGHVDKGGFATAGATENGIVRAGLSLKGILSKRIATIPKKNLVRATKAMEDRLAAHPDCPSAAFEALRTAAAKLEGPPYRAWILALTPLLPGPLAADETVALGSSEVETAFAAAKNEFVEVYAARMIMKEALPAAAAAAWYVDGAAGAGRIGFFVHASQQALASLSSFLRNLGAIDPRLVAVCLAEDELIASAFAECVALAWVAYGRERSHFAADLGLEVAVVRRALEVAWRATIRNPELASPTIEADAVRRAEAFVARMEEQRDPARLLGILAELKRDRPAFDAVRLGARYESVRERCRSAFIAALETAAEALEAGARKSPAAVSDRFATADGKEDRGPTFHLMTGGNDPFSVITLAAAFELPLGGVSLRTAVPPSSLAPALGPLAVLVDVGSLVVTVPCLVVGAVPSAEELALLGAGFGWIGDGEAVASEVLARLCGRYGIPSAFVALPIPQNTARRLADFGAAPARFMRFSLRSGVGR